MLIDLLYKNFSPYPWIEPDGCRNIIETKTKVGSNVNEKKNGNTIEFECSYGPQHHSQRLHHPNISWIFSDWKSAYNSVHLMKLAFSRKPAQYSEHCTMHIICRRLSWFPLRTSKRSCALRLIASFLWKSLKMFIRGTYAQLNAASERIWDVCCKSAKIIILYWKSWLSVIESNVNGIFSFLWWRIIHQVQ